MVWICKVSVFKVNVWSCLVFQGNMAWTQLSRNTCSYQTISETLWYIYNQLLNPKRFITEILTYIRFKLIHLVWQTAIIGHKATMKCCALLSVITGKENIPEAVGSDFWRKKLHRSCVFPVTVSADVSFPLLLHQTRLQEPLLFAWSTNSNRSKPLSFKTSLWYLEMWVKLMHGKIKQIIAINDIKDASSRLWLDSRMNLFKLQSLYCV